MDVERYRRGKCARLVHLWLLLHLFGGGQVYLGILQAGCGLLIDIWEAG